ncbi:SH3 domain-containing protein [Shinella pollutisoli]|uniref:SH3 domain-containing protein n=1 Tax=Shinella pollutisoli TaxID=2250594 RepID=A0ABV7DHG3_9HYPH|nr:SH3 domain-containing protein [Shinella pollutisoli]
MVQDRLNALLRAAALLCLLPMAAMAGETLGWHGAKGEEGGASLFYGIPQSDHAPVSFSCPQAGGDLLFAVTFEPAGAADGEETEVLLRAGDITVPIVTTGTRIEMDDSFVLEGRTALDRRLVDLLASRGTLTVSAGDEARQFPLDGAREAAAALIEACAAEAARAAVPGVDACAISAWSTDPDPDGLNVRAAPRGDAAIIGTLPAARDVGGERFATEVSITGSKDGWLRISEGWVLDYIGDDPIDVVFEGEGWVSGRHIGLRLNYRHLHSAPANDSPVVATIAGTIDGMRYGPDSILVDRIHACRGDWLEVEGVLTIDGTAYGPRLRGWTTKTCSNQVTTCP